MRCCSVLMHVAAFVLLFPLVSHGFSIEKLNTDFAFAPLHNEVVGILEVDRYRLGLDFRFSVLENKKGMGLIGAELTPKYYWGGYYPDQRDRWGAGEIQRLEIEYRIYVRPTRHLEFFAEHYSNKIIKDGELLEKIYNEKIHNLFGFRIWFVNNVF